MEQVEKWRQSVTGMSVYLVKAVKNICKGSQWWSSFSYVMKQMLEQSPTSGGIHYGIDIWNVTSINSFTLDGFAKSVESGQQVEESLEKQWFNRNVSSLVI